MTDVLVYYDVNNVRREVPTLINGVTVVRLLPKVVGEAPRAITLCIHCNTEKETRLPDLKNGKAKSCLYCVNRGENNGRYRVGNCYDPIRAKMGGVWDNMKKRVGAENTPYENVSICDEWIDNVDAFIDWALLSFEEGLTIDKDKYYYDRDITNIPRIYSPETCCWLTRKEQCKYRDTTNIGGWNKGLTND